MLNYDSNVKEKGHPLGTLLSYLAVITKTPRNCSAEYLFPIYFATKKSCLRFTLKNVVFGRKYALTGCYKGKVQKKHQWWFLLYTYIHP